MARAAAAEFTGPAIQYQVANSKRPIEAFNRVLTIEPLKHLSW
jgi:hypothetical protein